jgi:hypothetical protein
VGIIGALASILASILVPPAQTQEERDDDATAARTLQNELAEIRNELTALRRSLAADGTDPPSGPTPVR